MAQQVVISFNANANFSDLIGEVRRANAEIATLQTQLNGLGSASYASLNNLNSQFIEGMRNTRLWSSSFVDVTNETREFGRHLDQGRLKLKDYFREFNTQVRGQRGMIRRLAEEQVKLQRSILTTTVGPQGEARNILSTPTGLDRLDPSTMKALRAEQFKIIGRSIQGVSTELINLGKNTQWAGRQLTVGLTVPLTIFASTAANAFRETDKQLTRLAKVYGDIGGATTTEIERIKTQTASLAKELASSLGAAANETIGLAADIAATGKTGNELLESVAETTRLAILGEVDRQEAMSATLSLQSAFNLNTKELAESINFLNAVENQTSTSLNDLVVAIPKAGPVVRQLGGDVQDLALFLTAMREGGINAAESANALKSGLASIINPTEKTVDVMSNFGVDILSIVNSNAGDLVGTVSALKDALNTLNPLARAQAIEQLFGKFQFARMSALFDNLGRSGSQTLQVMELMGASTADLAAIAERELTTLTESASGKFARQMETLKANLALAGEGFLGIFSKVIGVVNKLMDGFNNLPDGAKTVLTIIGAIVGLAGPLIMLSGVFLNFIGYVVKSIGFLGRLFTSTKKFELLDEQMMAVKLSGDKAANAMYSEADAAKAAAMQIQNLISRMRELVELQNTYAAGAEAAPGFAGSRFMPSPEFGTGSGVRPTGIERSHLLNRARRRAIMGDVGLTDEELVKVSGVSGGRKTAGVGNINNPLEALNAPVIAVPADSIAAQIQGAFAESMPNTIVAPGTTFEQKRGMLSDIAAGGTNKEAQKIMAAAMRDPERYNVGIEQVFQTSEEYAKIQATHVANMTAINDAYKGSAVEGEKFANQMKDAWTKEFAATQDPAAAARAAAQLARERIGTSYDDVISTTNASILRAFEDGGADSAVIEATKREVAAMQGGILKNAAATTVERTGRLSLAIAQASAQIDAVMNAEEIKVKTGTKSLGTATVKMVDGVVQVITESGRVLSEDAVKNPQIKAKIAELRAKKAQLEQEKVKEIQEIINIENAGISTLAADSPAAKVGLLGRAKNGMRGMFTGRAGLGSSMAMMGLGMATSMVPQTGGVGNIAGGAMMGASMGMMFGAPGAAVGAALGALVPAIKMTIDYFKKLADIQALSIRQYQIDKEYAKAAGLSLKTIGDIQLTQVTGKSEEAASALEILAQAALEAATSTSTGALREKTKGADSFKEVQDEFLSQYLSYIAAGVSEETAKQMMAAILKAAGKEGFATDLKMLLAGESGVTQTGALKRNLERIKGSAGSVVGTEFSTLLGQAGQFGIDQGIAQRMAMYGEDASGFGPEAAKYITDLTTAYQKLNAAQRDNVYFGTATKQAIEAINNAMANSDAATFAEAMKEVAGSGLITQEVVDGVAGSIEGLTRTDKTVLEGLKKNGVDSEAQMLALKMRIEGIIPSLEAVKNFDGMRIRAYFELYQANQALDKAKSDLQASLQGMFAGGAAGPNKDAQKKAIQAQIDALEEIERKEKNINKIKELQLKYEEKRRSLALDYLGALSSGDMEGALRAQLEMQAESARFLKEKAETEKEIARDDKKKALQDKLKALDNAAAGSVANVANKAKDLEKNINDAIQTVLGGFQKDGKVTVSFKEFVESEAFRNFESKFKGALSGDALQKAMATLKASFKQLEADLANVGGLTDGPGTSKSPRDITVAAAAAGITSAEGKDGVATALSGDQKRKLLSYLAGRGESFVENEIVTLFGEKYRYDKDKNDLIRNDKKWMGGKVRGYYGGGFITGPGNSVSDSINIAASNNEFMMNARAVSKYGVANMEKINNRTLDPRAFETMRNAGSYNEGDVRVNINNINITDPGCSPEEIIARIKKDLGAAIKRTTDDRRLSV